MDSNNKSTVITCLMTIHMLKHLGIKEKYDQIMELLGDKARHYGKTFVKIVRIGMLYFEQKPSDTLELNPIIYVKYNPTLISLAN